LGLWDSTSHHHRSDLNPGDTFALTLNFEKSGPVTVLSDVKNP